MAFQPLTVTEVNQYIKQMLEQDQILSQVSVRGELSNYKMHSSGHHYFTLKDDGAVISAVMFRGDASKLRFRPENGMKVILSGRISLFPKSGQYQIYVRDMQPDGVGALYIAFEQLKQKLYAEGLFDPAKKQQIPRYPGKIALVTSPTGAAVRDMIRILRHRYPLAKVLVCPVKVQGDGAAEEIAAMLDYVNDNGLADVIITGRGGGSMEDLWAFNEEVVARSIFRSRIPVISAVGHEPDVTISDYVADLRAATPSNAAELAVVDGAELKVRLQNVTARMTQTVLSNIRNKRQQLRSLSEKKIMRSPYEYLSERRMLLAMLQQRLEGSQAGLIQKKKQNFASLAASLDAMSPLKVLGRGYAMALKGEDVVQSASALQIGDKLKLQLRDGVASCCVESVEIKE
jgi:exodeoxyribonuclease VII large subunit